MSAVTIFNAEPRQKTGTLATKKLRRTSRIPAVIYSNETSGSINISVDVKQFEQEYFKGNLQTTIVEILLEGKTIKAISHKIELDPVTDRPIHIDFFNCNQEYFKAQPKVTFTNTDKSPGLKRGGFLNVVKRKIKVICKAGTEVPAEVFYDISNLRVAQKVRALDLVLPEGVTLETKSEALIASITGRASKEDSATDTASGVADKKPVAPSKK